MIKWEDKDRQGEKGSLLFLINYIDACHHSGPLFRNVISLDTRNEDNKKANTKRIKDLNNIRNITAHPKRGVLIITQVDFVNDCFESVEKYFPADASHSAPGGGRSMRSETSFVSAGASLCRIVNDATPASLRIKPFRIRPRNKPGVVVRHVQRQDRRRAVDLILPRHYKSQVSALGPN